MCHILDWPSHSHAVTKPIKFSNILVFESLAHCCPELLYTGLVVFAKDLNEVVDIEEDNNPFIYEDIRLLKDRMES